MTNNNGKVRCSKKKGTIKKAIKKHVFKRSTRKSRSSRNTCLKQNSKKTQTVISRKRNSPRRSSSLNNDNCKRVLRNKKISSSRNLVNNKQTSVKNRVTKIRLTLPLYVLIYKSIIYIYVVPIMICMICAYIRYLFDNVYVYMYAVLYVIVYSVIFLSI